MVGVLVHVADRRDRRAERGPDAVVVDAGRHHEDQHVVAVELPGRHHLDLHGRVGLAVALLADGPGVHVLRHMAERRDLADLVEVLPGGARGGAELRLGVLGGGACVDVRPVLDAVRRWRLLPAADVRHGLHPSLVTVASNAYCTATMPAQIGFRCKCDLATQHLRGSQAGRLVNGSLRPCGYAAWYAGSDEGIAHVRSSDRLTVARRFRRPADHLCAASCGSSSRRSCTAGSRRSSATSACSSARRAPLCCCELAAFVHAHQGSRRHRLTTIA